MKINKSILTVTAIGALFAATVFAAEPLLSPRAAESAPKVIASAGKDCHTATVAAKAKSSDHCVMSGGKNANDVKTVAACCKK